MLSASRFRQSTLALVLSLPLGVYTGVVIAETPREALELAPPAFLLAAAQQAQDLFASDAASPAHGRKSVPFQSPWIEEREFGNSPRVAAGQESAPGNKVVLSESASAVSPSASGSALAGGTMAMLSTLPTVAGRTPS